MDEVVNDLAGLVDVIVRPLVTHEEDVEIVATEQGDNHVLIEINVNEEDAGKVIGRQGRVIKAIRTLTRACASKSQATVDVELID